MAWTSPETKMDTGQLYVTTDGEHYTPVTEVSMNGVKFVPVESPSPRVEWNMNLLKKKMQEIQHYMSVLNNLPEVDLKNRSSVLERIDADKKIIRSRYGIHEFNTGIGGYIFAYDQPAWALFDSSEKEYHDFRRIFPYLCMYNRAWDERIGIPTVTSKVWTKSMLIERTKELTKQRAERLQKPITFNVSCSSMYQKIIDNYILESLKQSEEQLKMKEYLFSAPKYVVSGEYIPFELIHQEKPKLKDLYFKHCQDDRVDATVWAFKHYNEITKQQEETKMDAKKCDRCGKLYIENGEPVMVYLSGRVTDHEKDTFTPEKVREINTYRLETTINGGNRMDMCPDCKKKLKEFFESETVETKEAET